MNPILSGTEAFNAMMAGKHVMCRPIGDMLDFNELDQFPATIFAKAGFEFCLKLEMMEVSGITFTKPLTPDEVVEGQDVFMIGSTGTILQGKFIPECEGLVKALRNGFVQRDGINAQNQLKALHALLGVDGFIQHRTIDFKNYQDDEDKPVKKPRPRKAKAVDPVNIQGATLNDAAAPTKTKPAARTAFSIEDVAEIKTDPESENLSVENLQRLQIEAEKLVTDNKLADEAELEYQKLLNDLLQRAANAALPAEATALTGYTKSWSEAQRKPLLDAIHKRLNELNPPEQAEVKEPPSLMVQIQNAQNEHELNELLPDIRSRHPDIQPKLMGCVKRRRFELENQGSEVAQ